jgi:hypothetical protein
MATLHCQHCEARIDSDARHTQCRSCGALFPFQCEVCARKLRGPFSVFEDERYLTLDEGTPKPLCGDHFLRKCPDCDSWFQADENEGFFRCLSCSEKTAKQLTTPEWDDGGRFESENIDEREPHGAPLILNARHNPNTLVLAGAGCAFVALVSWFLLAAR